MDGECATGTHDCSSIPVFRDPVGVVYAMNLGGRELQQS